MTHTLLLADDSVTIQRVIELTFADEDVRVIAVGDGRQAIDRIQSERPDIVLADVGMPERDGYEVAAFVKGHPDFAHVPVLLLTGAFEPIDEGRARAAGCDGVLVKPFEPQMVINRVKDLLAGRRPPGSWAAVPAAQPPAGDLDVRRAAAQETTAGDGSLEEYFDRLDAAFAERDASGPAVAGDPPRPSAANPGLDTAPPRPLASAAIESPRATAHTAAPQPHVQAPVGPAPDAAPAPPLPAGTSLAGAFTALLAAERGQPIAPPSIRPQDIPDDTIEDIVRRVIDRMGTEAVHARVIEVAERMVQEEIARIKRGSS